MSQNIEDNVAVVQYKGLNTAKAVDFSAAPTVSLPSGTTINGASATPNTITSNSANALAVGANGTTNPVLKVDASASSVATGVSVTGAAAGSGATIAAISSGSNETLALSAKGTNPVSVTSRLAVTSTASSAIAVGRQGSTNPVLQVDASTSSVATGVKVTGAAAGGGVAVAAISSGSNEALSINALGTGLLMLQSATAVPAAGSAAASVRIGASGPGVFVGSGAPTVSAPQGSLYLRTDGSSSSTRAYINSDGSTGWVAVTTAS